MKNYFSQKHFRVCCEIVGKVLSFEQSTSSLIFHYFKKSVDKFGSKERKQITDIAFSVVRNKSYFQSLINDEKPNLGNLEELRFLVILGVVSRLGKKAISPLLTPEENMLLKKINIKSIRNIYVEHSKSKLLNEKLSVPSWIFNDWVNQRSIEKTINFIESNHANYSIYCRVNLLRTKVKDVIEKISACGFVVEQSSSIKECLKFLPGENLNQIRALFASGEIEIQDFGSQLIAKLVAPKRHQMVVDFCAGSGGKALALGMQMKNTGKIFALDINANKITKLKKRIFDSGLKNIWPLVIRSLEDERLSKFHARADAVLVDAPCSGLGTLRRNPELKWRVSKADIKTKKKNQLCILVKAALFCKVGGYLVYATCSTIYEENEAVVREFLSNSDEFHRCDNNLALEKQNIFLDNTWNVFDSYGNIHLWSDLTGTDSFFMTRLIRIK